MACATLVIEVRGGFVQRVIADRDIKVILSDYDTDEGPGLMPVEVSTGVVRMFEEDLDRQQHLQEQIEEGK